MNVTELAIKAAIKREEKNYLDEALSGGQCYAEDRVVRVLYGLLNEKFDYQAMIKRYQEGYYR